MENPYRVTSRHPGKKEAAVVFVPGFTGDAVKTWTGFPDMLAEDPDLGRYDFYFWGYPSNLKLSYMLTKYFWEDDPNLTTIGRGLRTLLDSTIAGYEKLVLVGHSMGGLVIQASVLEEIGREARSHLDRITEIALYAAPSGGKHEARWGSFLKNQIADM